MTIELEGHVRDGVVRIVGKRVTFQRWAYLRQTEQDPEKRRQLKDLGFAALYSNRPSTRVLLPLHLLREEDLRP